MGQYYHALLERNNKVSIFQPIVNGDWQGLKLTEHSWWKNDFMSVIAKKILKKPTRIIWVGDYSENEELQALNPNFTLDTTYNSEKAKGVKSKVINNDILNGKYLVNHDKKVYIDLDRYRMISDEISTDDWKGWVINPISLLTAVGNNRGGGDYYDGNICFKYVGTWAYDLISLETKIPTDYTEQRHIVFCESLKEDVENKLEMYGIENDLISNLT